MSGQGNDFYSRRFEVMIDDISIKSLVGPVVPIKQMVTYLEFTENIFSNFVVGQITMVDGSGFMEKYSILGRELISIKYRTPFDTKQKTLTLRLSTMLDKVKNNLKDVMRFRLVSVTGYTDMLSKRSKSFKGTYSNIAKDICKEYYKQDLKDIDQTSQDIEIAFPYKRPSEMLTDICKKSYSTSSNQPNSSAGYVFYETTSGLHFKSLVNLYEQEPINYFIMTMTDRNRFDMDDLNLHTHLIEDLSINKAFNRPVQLHGGGLNSSNYSYDTTTKIVGKKDVSYFSDSYVSNNKGEKFNPVIASEGDENSGRSDITYSPRALKNFKNQESNEGDLASTKPFANMNYVTHDDSSLKFTCAGDSRYEAGQTIEIILPKNDASTNITNGEFSEELTSTYLVKSLTHRFYLPETGSDEMKTTVLCVRNFRSKAAPNEVRFEK